MRRHGHPILGAIAGFFLFFFIGLDLMLFGTIRTYSNLITILPLIGIVVGFLWGWWSPFRRKKLAAARAAASAPVVVPAAPVEAAPPAEAAPVPAISAEPEHMASPTRTTDGNEPPPLS